MGNYSDNTNKEGHTDPHKTEGKNLQEYILGIDVPISNPVK